MRQMAHRPENFVMQMGIHCEHHGAGFLPHPPDPAKRLGVCPVRRSDDTACTDEELIRSGRHTGLFLAGNGMGSDKMDPLRHGPLSLFDQPTLHASDVGHNGAFF